jgi:Spy/CpxP family protein refolding chaperone
MSPRHLSLLAASLILLGGTIAIADPSAWFGRSRSQPEATLSAGDPNLGDEGWLKDLNLSPAQLQQVRSIRNQRKDSLIQQRREMGQAQRRLQEMMAGETTAAQIRRQYSQVRTLREQIAENQFNTLLETREVLTLEQRRKFAEQMQQRRKQKEPQRERLRDQTPKS